MMVHAREFVTSPFNTYRKRQTIRDQYSGKIDEDVFTRAAPDVQRLESALKAAMSGAMTED
jgi:hypothetical protein